MACPYVSAARPRNKGHTMVCPYKSQDAMQVVGHDHKLIEFGVAKVARYLDPAILDD